jgi:hypothetical protein
VFNVRVIVSKVLLMDEKDIQKFKFNGKFQLALFLSQEINFDHFRQMDISLKDLSEITLLVLNAEDTKIKSKNDSSYRNTKNRVKSDLEALGFVVAQSKAKGKKKKLQEKTIINDEMFQVGKDFEVSVIKSLECSERYDIHEEENISIFEDENAEEGMKKYHTNQIPIENEIPDIEFYYEKFNINHNSDVDGHNMKYNNIKEDTLSSNSYQDNIYEEFENLTKEGYVDIIADLIVHKCIDKDKYDRGEYSSKDISEAVKQLNS